MFIEFLNLIDPITKILPKKKKKIFVLLFH